MSKPEQKLINPLSDRLFVSETKKYIPKQGSEIQYFGVVCVVVNLKILTSSAYRLIQCSDFGRDQRHWDIIMILLTVKDKILGTSLA